jgi:predicted metalloendopeptidase
MEKANHVAGYIGYPRWIRDPAKVTAYYAGLKFDYTSFFSNILSMMQWIAKKEIDTFFAPVDRSWTEDSPAEADAFYDDERNAVS